METKGDGFVRSGDDRPPFVRLVPLEELLAETLGVGRRTRKVGTVYQRLCDELGGELQVLSSAEEAGVTAVAGERVAEAIIRARRGLVSIEAGFDGQYGTVRVWDG